MPPDQEAPPRTGVHSPRSSSAARSADEDRRWVDNWLVGELRWAQQRVEHLERRLRRRTLALVATLAVSGVVVVAAGSATVPLYEPIVRLGGASFAAFEGRRDGSAMEPAQVERRAVAVEPQEAVESAAVAEVMSDWSEEGAGTAPEDPAALSEAARQDGALRVGSERREAEAEPIEPTTTAGHEAASEIAALREALAETRRRVEELEAAGTEREATVTGLRGELEQAQAEAERLNEQLALSRQGSAQPRTPRAAAERAETAGAARAGAAVQARAAGASAVAVETTAQGAPGVPAAAAEGPIRTGGDGARAGDERRDVRGVAAAEYVATNPVNLRAAPANAAEVLAVVEQGDVVRRIGERRGWMRVEYTDRLARDVTGWVHGRYLRALQPPSQATGSAERAGG